MLDLGWPLFYLLLLKSSNELLLKITFLIFFLFSILRITVFIIISKSMRFNICGDVTS